MVCDQLKEAQEETDVGVKFMLMLFFPEMVEDEMGLPLHLVQGQWVVAQ